MLKGTHQPGIVDCCTAEIETCPTLSLVGFRLFTTNLPSKLKLSISALYHDELTKEGHLTKRLVVQRLVGTH